MQQMERPFLSGCVEFNGDSNRWRLIVTRLWLVDSLESATAKPLEQKVHMMSGPECGCIFTAFSNSPFLVLVSQLLTSSALESIIWGMFVSPTNMRRILSVTVPCKYVDRVQYRVYQMFGC